VGAPSGRLGNTRVGSTTWARPDTSVFVSEDAGKAV